MIGTERALYLIGQLPRCYQTRRNSKQTCWHVILYVPKTLKPDHHLVRLIGWHDASKLVDAFGGEILQPANCSQVYRSFRDQSAVRMVREGNAPQVVCELLGISERTLRNLMREKAQEDQQASNDNTAPKTATSSL